MLPQNNREVLDLLFDIEIAVRELVIEKMEAVAGPKWFRQRLPPDVFSKCREGRTAEARASWTRHLAHHPIYYADFPDLIKIIAREDNWRDAFRQILNRKDMVEAHLRTLEPIRNKAAHNRVVTSSDVEIASGSLSAIKELIGNDLFSRLVSRQTPPIHLGEELKGLAGEVEDAAGAIENLTPLRDSPIWWAVRDRWWFDEDYLGVVLTPLVGFWDLCDEYREHPRLRGTANRLEAWRDRRYRDRHKIDALETVRTLVGELTR